jgi:amino acid efflux transporter
MDSMAANDPEAVPGLVRPERLAPARPSPRGTVTLPQGIALYVGAVLGTGILALPALAARTAGPASLVAWGAMVALSVPLAAAFAALAARYPDAGGVSTFVRRAFGPRAAAVAGWCFYLTIPVGAPAAGMFAGSYVADAIGGGRTTVLLVSAGLIAATVLTNLFGLRVSGKLQLLLAGLLVALISLASIVSLPHARLGNLSPFAPHGWLAIGPAAELLLWSFAGWEAITHLSGEFRRPRDLVLATAAAVAIVGVLYLGVAVATISVLGPAAGRREAPVADLLAIGLGGSARAIAAVMAVVLTLGVLNAYHAAAAKLGAALGRDGAMPAWLARGSEANEIPRRALVVLGVGSAIAVTAVAVTRIDPRPLVQMATASLVAVYVLGMTAAVRLLDRGSPGRNAAFVGLIAVGAMLVVAGPYLLWPAVLSAGSLLYARRRVR